MGLWVHVSDTREHRLYEREASRAPSRELKRVSAPKSYSVTRAAELTSTGTVALVAIVLLVAAFGST